MERLAALIEIPSISPNEGPALSLVAPWLTELGFEVRLEPIHSEIATHPAFTPHPRTQSGISQGNLRAKPRCVSGKRRVLFNCHADVVPGSARFPEAFKAQIRADSIVGRGACDTKGNLVMLLESLAYIQETGLPMTRDVFIDVVVEEEIGGNGTLSTLLHEVVAEEVVVLEPTSLRVYRGHRGCVTFSYEVNGRPAHMGAGQNGISAVDGAFALVEELRRWEAELLRDARQDPDFAIWERPVQVNVGRVAGGEWPGSVPAQCIVEGNAGFLPGSTSAEVMGLLHRRVEHLPSEWLRKNTGVRFPGLRTEGYRSPADAAVVTDLTRAAVRFGVPDKHGCGWNVSCDARLYDQLAGLPAVIFGAGDLSDAHSDGEKITFEALAAGMAILVSFLTNEPTEAPSVANSV